MKKGFTLIEMLAVILVLGVVSLIIIPRVNNIIKNQKRNLYEKQVERIEEVAENWGAKHTDLLPDYGSIYIGLNELVTSGELKASDLINPKTEEEMVGCIEIKLDEAHNQYVFNFIDAMESNYNNECDNYL